MRKPFFIFSIVMIFLVPATAQVSTSNYSAYINLATFPGITGFNGRMYSLHNDTMRIVNRNGFVKVSDTAYKDIYDTTYYSIPSIEKERMINRIRSVDSLESVFNFCIIDGLRLYFSCSLDSIEHDAWVGNAYDPTIFFFIDIINGHVPEELQIRYDKDRLLTEEKKCLKERFGIIR